jgi:hypothetical protein
MSLIDFIFGKEQKKIALLEKQLKFQEERLIEYSLALRQICDFNVKIVRELEMIINVINSGSKHPSKNIKEEDDDDFYN